MKHLGDITKIIGYDSPVVDVIIGGSPCQDLSLAGKRAGLAGERSGLYMEQIRIVKEMREADVLRGRTGEFIRPRYMVWENVPGAFSSNGGKDFAAVIEEIIKICEPDADVQVCVPDKGWTKSGCYYAEDGRWSVAWRVHDAQFWGVPQRRKRIALVADFGGITAPEILFERKGLHWNPEPGRKARQATAAGTESGTGSAISFQERAGKPGGGKGILIQPERTGALSTLNNQAVLAVDCRNGREQAVNGTLQVKSNGGVSYNLNNVRRLTPLECERLQRYPDRWTDIGDWIDSKGKTHKAADSPRYKALGNSIALPYWKVLLKRISAQYDRDATMASLFDGIGGFPFLWEQINGKGSCLWASEIEEFPMAVTKKRFGVVHGNSENR